MKRVLICLTLLSIFPFLLGCPDTASHSRGVYLLMDTSGTYKNELNKARSIVYYLLSALEPGDSLGVARIDTASFTEKNIIKKVTFDGRPSVSNGQKRAFREAIDRFISSVRGSSYTDITGGILQAVEYLKETGAGNKYIFIFSDLQEDLAKGFIRDFEIEMDGFNVVALNVTKLRSDNMDPREYMKRLKSWKKRVEGGGGHWKVINDLERLDSMLTNET
ncbi:MAG: vWA domain-containing protein [Desulfatiglans sp.]|jgi:hypothetical protein|nr:vWA domain-containing protein [Thermodesulfobacteriota bacterium]MEE4353244.1 vWA domain-containing protein [Desulfatiglans sp.]